MYFANFDQISNFRPSRNIFKGQVLEFNSIVPAQIVRIGKNVTVIVNQNGFNLSMQGQALQSGSFGEIISVKNISSQKIINARVVGFDRVAIEL